jgi:hypothetical protein
MALELPRPSIGINQTSFLFGALIFAFLFFITVRGDLGQWLGLLGLAGGSGASGNTAAPSLPALPALSAPSPVSMGAHPGALG